MASIQTNVSMSFGGSTEACCYVEIKSIGALVPSKMTKVFCDLIHSMTDIPLNRIYINFDDVDGSNWGFNSNTFG